MRDEFLELGVDDGVIVARTDSLGAGLTKQIAITHEVGDLGDQYNSFLDVEELDPSELNHGDVLINQNGKVVRPKRLPSNLYRFKEGTGEARCILDSITSLQNGADLIWIETISALDELKAALDAAKRTGLPTSCTLSFDTHGSTMMGINPKTFVEFCEETNLISYGANCGIGPSEMVDTVLKMKNSQKVNIPIIAKGNCGIPFYKDEKIVYSGTPDIMGNYAITALKAGAKIIGGCCGTTPLHIRPMREALEKISLSASYYVKKHLEKLGVPWKDTDRSKKRIRRSSSRNKIT